MIKFYYNYAVVHPCCSESEVLGYEDEDNDGLFEEGADPDKKDVEYTGNEGTNVQHWYYTSAIVLWPRKFSMSIQCSAGFEGAAATALRRAQAGELDARQAFKEVMAYAKAHPRKSVPSCGTLLNTAVVFKSVDESVEALRLLANTMPAESASYSNRYTSSPAGASGITCPTEVANAVGTLGWTALGDTIVAIAKVQPIKHVTKALALLSGKGEMLLQRMGALRWSAWMRRRACLEMKFCSQPGVCLSLGCDSPTSAQLR